MKDLIEKLEKTKELDEFTYQEKREVASPSDYFEYFQKMNKLYGKLYGGWLELNKSNIDKSFEKKWRDVEKSIKDFMKHLKKHSK